MLLKYIYSHRWLKSNPGLEKANGTYSEMQVSGNDIFTQGTLTAQAERVKL